MKSSMIHDGTKMIFVYIQFYSIDLLLSKGPYFLKSKNRQNGRKAFYFSLPTLVLFTSILSREIVQLIILFVAKAVGDWGSSTYMHFHQFMLSEMIPFDFLLIKTAFEDAKYHE